MTTDAIFGFAVGVLVGYGIRRAESMWLHVRHNVLPTKAWWWRWFGSG